MGARRASTNRAAIAALAEQMERDLGGIRQALRRPLDAEVAKGELTAPQTSVMQVVVRHDGISLKDLSQAVSLAHSTVSGIADRLEKRGLLSRRTDSQDGRISRVYPSAAVREFMRDRLPKLARGPLESALERATDPERTKIAEAIKRLRELLEEA
jgi:DNA-binding MarR family transcriptional regulator